MKAILVVDIDANELPEDAYANVYVFGKYGEHEDDFVACIGDVPLKPMPTYDWHEEGKENECEEWYKNGWNDCIDAIIGGTKGEK